MFSSQSPCGCSRLRGVFCRRVSLPYVGLPRQGRLLIPECISSQQSLNGKQTNIVYGRSPFNGPFYSLVFPVSQIWRCASNRLDIPRKFLISFLSNTCCLLCLPESLRFVIAVCFLSCLRKDNIKTKKTLPCVSLSYLHTPPK